MKSVISPLILKDARVTANTFAIISFKVKRCGVGTNEPVKIFLRDAYSAMKLSEIRVQIFLFKLDIMMKRRKTVLT